MIKKWFTARDGEPTRLPVLLFNGVLAACILLLIFGLTIRAQNLTFDFSFLGDYTTRIVDGFLMTVELSLAGMAASLVIGALAALGKGSRILVFRDIAGIYITVIRGTPLIMQIYLFFYIIGTAWGIDNRFTAGVLILSVFEGAYIAEILRGSLLSIDSSQRDAAQALGFSRLQTARYILLPQLVARTLPALTGQFASIIKDSSLLSIIAVIELTQTMREISASNFKLFECYLFLGALYLCLTLPVTAASRALEKRFDYDR